MTLRLLVGCGCLLLCAASLHADEVVVPTGSGETLVALSWAAPEKEYVAEYNGGPETKYNDRAPMNGLVRALAAEVQGVEHGSE